MTEDFETLKVIRDKEQSVDEEIEEFLNRQKKELEEAKADGNSKLESRREELENKYSKEIEKLRKELDRKRLEIIEEGEARATTIRLSVTDREIEKIVMESLNQYLEG